MRAGARIRELERAIDAVVSSYDGPEEINNLESAALPNKRAVVDRLIQQAFSEMYLAASPYLDGDGEPRGELRAGLARVVNVVNRHARVLLVHQAHDVARRQFAEAPRPRVLLLRHGNARLLVSTHKARGQ